MLNKGVLYLLVAAVALLASPGLAPPAAAAPIRWLVGADSASCAGQMPDFSTIFEAILIASPGDTIHVCPGDYTEPSMTIYDDELTIEGSGATVTHVHWSGASSWWPAVFQIEADYVVVQGLDVDATPAHPGDDSYGILFGGESVTIQNNEIRNATKSGVGSLGHRRHAQVLSNNIHDNGFVAGFEWDDSAFSGNTVNGGGHGYISIIGERDAVTSNVVVNGTVAAWGDDLLVSNNQISGGAGGPLIIFGGGSIGVTDNTLSDTTGYGIEARTDTSWFSTSATIARNTFNQVDAPIHLLDSAPGDAFTLTATIGGSASEANTLVDSGGALGDSNYLVHMDGQTIGVDAQYNNWGLCTLAEIEQEVYHQVDDPAQGLVDFDPFIPPSGCSTPTPTRTPTATVTVTPAPGPTRAVAIPAGSWANFAWTGDSSPQTVADCFGAGNIAVMYRLDAATQTFQRWIRGRDDLSNMGDVQRYDALLAFNASAQPAICTMPDVLLARSLTIPAGSWVNFAWLSNAGLPDGQVAQACGAGNIAVMYRLNAATQTFERWIRDREELSNMGEVQPYDALLALSGSDQPATCQFPIMIVGS